MKLRKSELKNILDLKWRERREKVKELSKKNSERTKAWKLAEKLANEKVNKENPPAPHPPQKRQKHYLEAKLEKIRLVEKNKK